MRTIKLISTLVFSVFFLFICISFALQNNNEVAISFHSVKSSAQPLSLWLTVTFVLGTVFAGIFSMIDIFKLRLQITKLKKHIKLLEKENKVLVMSEEDKVLGDDLPVTISNPSPQWETGSFAGSSEQQEKEVSH